MSDAYTARLVKSGTPTPEPVSYAQRVLASIVLGAMLLQVALFSLGFMDPYQRAFSLWGRPLEQRQQIVGPGAALNQLAGLFPPDAKIYWPKPQLHLHWNANYYFYPREIYISMTNGTYRYDKDYAEWNEYATDGWLASNKFTHELTFSNVVTRNGYQLVPKARAIPPLPPWETPPSGTSR
jgi:hypothetical protein